MAEAAVTPGEASGFSEQRFRAVLGRFVTGVAVMTAVDPPPAGATGAAVAAAGQAHGMTANAVTSVSLDPPLVLVCVERRAIMAEVVQRAGAFVLSFLAAGQADLSVWFSDTTRPAGDRQFADVPTSPGVTGTPILDGNVGWVECVTWAIHDGGDHLIVVGEVVALGEGAGDEPLVYHRGGYTLLRDRA